MEKRNFEEELHKSVTAVPSFPSLLFFHHLLLLEFIVRVRKKMGKEKLEMFFFQGGRGEGKKNSCLK